MEEIVYWSIMLVVGYGLFIKFILMIIAEDNARRRRNEQDLD